MSSFLRPTSGPRGDLEIFFRKVLIVAAVIVALALLWAARGVLLLASVPKNDPAGLPSREVLLEALKTGARRRLAPLRDTVAAGPLMATAPAPTEGGPEAVESD